MGKSFAKYAQYYDLLYKDKDYAAEVHYINKLLEKFEHQNRSVLEFGSGTGIHGLALSSDDRFVQGVEISPEMASQAVETRNFRIELGDIGSTVFQQKFGTVISLFHVMSYLTSREKQLEVFANANRHLELNGCFIFDVWYSPAVEAQVPELRVKRMADENLEVVRLAEPRIFKESKNVEVNYTIFIREKPSESFEVVSESHLMHHYDQNEVAALAAASGFETIKFEEFLTGNPASEGTWGVVFVLKKVAEVQ